MTLKEILDSWGGPSAVCILVLMTLIQISPIKLNPWSYIGRSIGKALNGEVNIKLDSLEKSVTDTNKKIDNLNGKVDENSASICRTRILRFGDELIHEKARYHTKEHFDQIMEDIDTYEKYCQCHPFYKNNKAVSTIKLIEKTYQHCMDEGSFL